MALFRLETTFEFCIDASDYDEALAIYQRDHAMAISDHRCGVMGDPNVSLIKSEGCLTDRALDEVPLNAYDYTARERLERE